MDASSPSIDYLSLPDWLTPAPPAKQRNRRSREAVDLEHTQFELAFGVIVDQLAQGRFLSSAINHYPIEIDYGRFLAWVRRDPERWLTYCDAQRCGGEMVMAQVMDPEIERERVIPLDPQVARLNFDKAKWYLGIIDRKRFAASQQISGDPDNPLEVRVVHSIARSPLDDYIPTAADGTALPAPIEGSAERSDDG